MKLSRCLSALALGALLTAPAAAVNFDDLLEGFSGSTDAQLEEFLQPLGDAAALLATSGSFHTGRSKGIAGLDAGVRFTLLPFSSGERDGILSEEAGSYAAQATAASGLGLPMLVVNKGLIKGFQVGARFMALELSKDVGSLGLMGASLRFEFNELFHVPLLMPRIGLQGDWSRLTVGDALETTATTFDLIVSKSFVVLEPYAGYTIGKATTNAAFETQPADAFQQPVAWDLDVKSDVSRLAVGLNVTPFPMLRLNVEAGLGDYSSYSAGLIFNLF